MSAVGCANSLCGEGDLCWSGKTLCKPGQRFKYEADGIDAQKNAEAIKVSDWREEHFNIP